MPAITMREVTRETGKMPCAWLQSLRRIWEERFDRLDDYLLELQATEQHNNNRIEDNNV